ncbi:MAG: SCO family protein [Pikeienuella sp.]
MPTTRTYAIAAAVLVAAGLGVGAFYAATRQDDAADCGGGLAGASIGGPFTLVSETGETVDQAAVIDGPTLVYFGYTFCPDVCPVDAANMAQAVDLLAAQGLVVKPVFISIDPARDTPPVMADYTEILHPTMLGLTGSAEQVAAAAAAYKVYYARAASDDPEYYLMNHSAYIYLMTAGERFLTFFRRGDTPQTIAETTACHLRAVEGGA